MTESRGTAPGDQPVAVVGVDGSETSRVVLVQAFLAAAPRAAAGGSEPAMAGS